MSRLCHGWLHNDDNNQRGNHQPKGHKRHNQDGPPAGGELALDDPLLARVVAVISQEQHEDADGEERGAERLAYVSERVEVRVIVAGIGRVRDGCVEAEELRYGDTDRSECERGPEPS